MAAKRSPILGYNHNVRFRGIVFHIQTEDSGIVNPHIFSHLFHGGVILSTRKLVYDPGSNDEAVKSLMQSQHKAVMKDLRRGAFDDKIDAYLVGTPGLLPRDFAEVAAAEAAAEVAAGVAAAETAAAETAAAEVAAAEVAAAEVAAAEVAAAETAAAQAANSYAAAQAAASYAAAQAAASQAAAAAAASAEADAAARALFDDEPWSLAEDPPELELEVAAPVVAPPPMVPSPARQVVAAVPAGMVPVAATPVDSGPLEISSLWDAPPALMLRPDAPSMPSSIAASVTAPVRAAPVAAPVAVPVSTFAPVPDVAAPIPYGSADPPRFARTRSDTERVSTWPADADAVPDGGDDSGEVSIEVIAAKPQAVLIDDADLLDAVPLPAEPRPRTSGPPATEPRRPASRSRPHPTPPVVAVPSDLGRAPTLRSADPPPLPPPEDDPIGSFATASKGDVSAAMRAIQLAGGAAASTAEEDLDEPAEIHAPALPSAPQPPGAAPERVGEYHLGRKSAVVETAPSARPPIPRPTPISSRLPTPSNLRPPLLPTARGPSPATGTRAPTPPTGARGPTPATGAPRVPPPVPPSRAPVRGVGPTPQSGPLRPTPVQSHTPVLRPTPQSPVPRVMNPGRTNVPGESPRPPVQPPRRPTSGGGVVVSRPAVIVGGRGAPTTPPAKVRRAKDAESFGGDLISERSLDEVILAYLSEDNSEE